MSTTTCQGTVLHGGHLGRIFEPPFQVHVDGLHLEDILRFTAYFYLLFGLERLDSRKPLPKECGRGVNKKIIIRARARRLRPPTVSKGVSVENVGHTHQAPVVEG